MEHYSRPARVPAAHRTAGACHRGRRIPGGARLPACGRWLAGAAVNPNTMQRALQELEARGLLNTQRTAGRTVTEDKTMIAQLREQLAAEQIGAFLQMMEKLGYTRAQTLALLQQKAQEE